MPDQRITYSQYLSKDNMTRVEKNYSFVEYNPHLLNQECQFNGIPDIID